MKGKRGRESCKTNYFSPIISHQSLLDSGVGRVFKNIPAWEVRRETGVIFTDDVCIEMKFHNIADILECP